MKEPRLTGLTAWEPGDPEPVYSVRAAMNPEGDGDVTMHATAPAVAEPRCPTCGRISAVWPSSIIPGAGHPLNAQALCGEFAFHGFTPGQHGTIAQLFDELEALSARLRPGARR